MCQNNYIFVNKSDTIRQAPCMWLDQRLLFLCYFSNISWQNVYYVFIVKLRRSLIDKYVLVSIKFNQKSLFDYRYSIDADTLQFSLIS
jgi:hypothetical protein